MVFLEKPPIPSLVFCAFFISKIHGSANWDLQRSEGAAGGCPFFGYFYYVAVKLTVSTCPLLRCTRAVYVPGPRPWVFCRSTAVTGNSR